MKYRVRITSLARRDIERNAQWWASKHSVEQAERWFYAIREQLQTLADFPARHAVSAENTQSEAEP